MSKNIECLKIDIKCIIKPHLLTLTLGWNSTS